MKRLSFCLMVLGLLVSLMLPVNAVDHEATLKSLRAEIAANNYLYTVKYSPVCDIPIDKLCTLKPQWAAASDIMFADDSCWETAEPENLAVVQAQDVPPSSILPAVYSGYCGPVKNQGACGSAWAFASIAAIESAFGDTCGWSLDLSEKWMIDCNSSGYGCSGGWFYFPSGCVIPLETGYNGDCSNLTGPLYKISGSWYVTGYPYPSVSNIKNAIYNYGGVAAGVYANSAFQYYSSGCFASCQNSSVNHAILLCGWDDSKCSSAGAWKLKNSWGTAWGENGFMWIKYGCSRVGYAACYATVVCADNPCN